MPRLLRSAFGASLYCALATVGTAHAALQEYPGPAQFGTIALPVGQTSLDHQWRRTLRPDSPSLLPLVAAARGHGRMEQLASINSRVNRLVDYRDDWNAWGTADRWSSSAETLARGSGDCEDIAIVKMDALLALGVAPEDLYLTIGSAGSRGHALLLVRVGGNMWVLDSLTDAIRSPDAYRDFQPMLTFGPAGRWIHAYARGAPAPRSGRTDTAVGGNALAATIAAQARGDR